MLFSCLERVVVFLVKKCSWRVLQVMRCPVHSTRACYYISVLLGVGRRGGSVMKSQHVLVPLHVLGLLMSRLRG